ncbi:MAG: hypothetical protein AB1540_16910 [Bdellovibrionota bacterium]
MRIRLKRKNGQSGQSLIEMILTLFAFFTVAFMYVQVSLGLGVANYIQYATFMSARSLLSGHRTVRDQKTAAQSVIEATLKRQNSDRFASIARAVGEGDAAGAEISTALDAGSRARLRDQSSRRTAWEQGVSYKFNIRLYMMPLLPGAKRGAANLVQLESESWLGRDPTEEECIQTLSDRKSRSGVNTDGPFYFDNGC